jgi:hypothetical protein
MTVFQEQCANGRMPVIPALSFCTKPKTNLGNWLQKKNPSI